MSEFSSFLPSLNQALKARQDRENGLIWADNIYEDRIYLGNGYDAKNYQQLTNHHITHIINCSANDVPNYYENYIPPFLTPEIATSSTPSETVTSGTAVSDHTPTTITPDESTIESRINENQFESSSPFQYINLDIQDFGQDKGISRVFQSVLDSVNEILLNPINKILIHCANGSNRSATIAIVVLMNLHGNSLPFSPSVVVISL